MASVLEIQHALLAHGFDPGPLDGQPGRRTQAAIRSFQAAHGLVADGIAGPKTLALLLASSGSAAPEVAPASMPWLVEAYRLMGTREQPGAGSNEAILGWAKTLRLSDYRSDDIPWCGLFVAHCVGSTLPQEALPMSPLTARSWQRLGVSCDAQLGSVLVFWRESRTSYKGHVGFYWAEDDDAFHVLGGNQSDAVTVTRIAKARLLGARWPQTAGTAPGRTRRADRTGRLSTDEA